MNATAFIPSWVKRSKSRSLDRIPGGSGSRPDLFAFIARWILLGFLALGFSPTQALAALPPTVVTGLATEITATTAVLNGTVNPNGSNTIAIFEYGATTAYGTTQMVNVYPRYGFEEQNVQVRLANLQIGSIYHYRITATNDNGTSVSDDSIFSTEQISGDYKYTSDNNGVIITKYIGSDKIVNIPATINGMEVISIGNDAFNNCGNVVSVNIPFGVINLGTNVFSSCANLTSITIPSSVASIGDGVGWHCPNLSTITVDSNNSNYSSVDGALFNKAETILIRCPSGKSGPYVIPSGITSIGQFTFYGCDKLTSLFIPYSVTIIGPDAFLYCNGLTNITIPSSVTRIDNYAFYGCSGLTSATFLGNAPLIGSGSFKYVHSSFVVQYYRGALSFSSPSWNGYSTVELDPISSLAIFQIEHGLPSDGSQNLLTPAGDGVPNLLKFAFNMLGTGIGQTNSLDKPNGSLLRPDGFAGLPRVGRDADTNQLTLTYVRRKSSSMPGVAYSVEFANDLTEDGWSENPSATETAIPLSDPKMERVTVTDSIANPPKRFVRVRVSQ